MLSWEQPRESSLLLVDVVALLVWYVVESRLALVLFRKRVPLKSWLCPDLTLSRIYTLEARAMIKIPNKYKKDS